MPKNAVRALRPTAVASLCFAGAALALAGLPAQADASALYYRIMNHPNGAELNVGLDEDGYALRMDANGQKNTFNANHSDLWFWWDPAEGGGSIAHISGYMTHNESGSDVTQWDAMDDVYYVDAKFQTVLFTDTDDTPAGSEWWGNRPDNQTYSDMVADLRNDANAPNTSPEQNHVWSDDVARIYWDLEDLSLSATTFNGLGNSYNGGLLWDEHGPDFYLQYRWRLWNYNLYGGADWDLVAGAGWLEQFEDQPVPGTHDWLFTLDSQPVPEPGTVVLLAVGGALGLLYARRRRGAEAMESIRL